MDRLRQRHVSRVVLPLFVAAVGCVVIAGCPGTVPSAAILAGDWFTENVEEGGSATVTFDENGIVIRITGEAADGTTAILNVSGATTELDSNAVTIVIPLGDGESAGFVGTLSDDQNTMTGQVGRAIEIGDNVLITIPAGEVTLERVQESPSPSPTASPTPTASPSPSPTPGPDDPATTFPTSLHFTRNGKRTYYAAEDGFQTITNIPFDDLACAKCHAPTLADGTPVEGNDSYTPSCADCHADVSNPSGDIPDATCLGCHGRQGAEINLLPDDVHRNADMSCVDCHTAKEMHGDGTEYISMLEDGATEIRCETCHTEGGSAPVPSPTNTFHLLHSTTLDCSACHVKSVSTCYSCHFESEVAETGKRFFAQTPRTGFKMLMNYRGKVHTATFQALVYDDQTFVTVAPFLGHAITKDDISCGDCHRQGGAGNANVQEYVDTGQITVTSWDDTAEGADRLVGPTGVIPIPEDWLTALQFSFVNYGGDATDPISGPDNLPLWDFLKTEKDGGHIIYGEPLTEDQMNALINN